MRVFVGKRFGKWAQKNEIRDANLRQIASEAFAGDVDADLGAYLFKKRIARTDSGKSGGYRTILCFRKADSRRLFFLYGFSKNEMEDIRPQEMKALKAIARSLVELTDAQIFALVDGGSFREL